MTEKYIKLIDAKSAAFTSEVVTMSDLVPRQGGTARKTIPPVFGGSISDAGTRDAYVHLDTTSGSARLVVEASLGQGSDFHEVDSFNDVGVTQITGYPRMRLKLDNVSGGGTHSAGIYGDLGHDGLIDILTDLSLTTNLELCLDAGDSNSYDGVSQTWADLSGSSNGAEFHLGTTPCVDADDPVFVGSAGHLSSDEYFSFDGTDLFRYGSANESWMEALHKNGASFTALFATRLPSGSEDALFGDISGAALTGIRLIYLFTDRKPVFEVYNAGATALSKSGDTAPPVDQWFFEAISIDENGGNVSFFWRDGAYNQVSGSNTFDAAYTSPAAGNAGVAFEIGAEGNAVDELNCGSRLGLAAFWSSALTKTQLDNIFNKVRGRFNV